MGLWVLGFWGSRVICPEHRETQRITEGKENQRLHLVMSNVVRHLKCWVHAEEAKTPRIAKKF
ncbi:MAG: hypothetical protein EA341_01175 [Mongoliibacter sp.]|nr:MAG: hypothetical protein EA341_01175 [Mongoliibacter sp.]